MIEARKNIIEFNNKFEAKISWKRKEAMKMANQIYEYISSFNITLPNDKKEWLSLLNTNLLTAGISLETYLENFEKLVNLYYTLKFSGYTVSAYYENEAGEFATSPVLHYYNRNRVDPVWNMRKSQLIRKKVTNFLKVGKYHEKYNALHLVLTVPHTNGKWNGKRFFAQEMIKAFNKLRKYEFWKELVFGGEYGIEVKRSQKHGLHIHVHSLLFVEKHVDINELREKIATNWSKLTNKDDKQTVVWLESLYYFSKTEKEAIKCIDYNEFEDDYGHQYMLQYKLVPKKIYIMNEIENIKNQQITNEEKETKIIEIFTFGVLECIKYHFKQDTFFTDDTKNYDIELLAEILNNTHNLRLYNRFGSLSGNTNKENKKLLYHLSFSDIENNQVYESFMIALQKSENGEKLTQKEERLLKVYKSEDFYETDLQKIAETHFEIDAMFQAEQQNYILQEPEEYIETGFEEENALLAVANKTTINPFTGMYELPLAYVVYKAETRHFGTKINKFRTSKRDNSMFRFLNPAAEISDIVKAIVNANFSDLEINLKKSRK